MSPCALVTLWRDIMEDSLRTRPRFAVGRRVAVQNQETPIERRLKRPWIYGLVSQVSETCLVVETDDDRDALRIEIGGTVSVYDIDDED